MQASPSSQSTTLPLQLPAASQAFLAVQKSPSSHWLPALSGCRLQSPVLLSQVLLKQGTSFLWLQNTVLAGLNTHLGTSSDLSQ